MNPHRVSMACLIGLPLLIASTGCQNGKRSQPQLPPPPVTFELARTGLPDRGNFKSDPVLVDFNGDGYLDLAIHERLGEGPRAWLWTPTGQWTPAMDGLTFGRNSCGGGIAAGDVNNDGHVDLVVADHCRGLHVYLGDGTGRWQMVVRELYPTEIIPENGTPSDYNGTEDVALGDVNEDGNLDLVAGASDTGGVYVFLGDGSGTNWTFRDPQIAARKWVRRVELADVNGDGHLDLAASDNAGPRVWLGDGAAGWTPFSDGLPSPIMGGIYHGLALNDVNEDGRPDLLISNWVDGPEAYLLGEDDRWYKTPDVFPQLLGGSYGLACGDVDGDGHLDIVITGRRHHADIVGYVYGVFWLRGDGNAKFTWVQNAGLPNTGLAFSWGVDLGDVNGDGKLDIAAGSGGSVATAKEPEHREPELPRSLHVFFSQPGAPE